MSTSQASQVSDTIDTPITTAQFLKNWTSGRYRNLIDWGTTAGGSRVTAEQQLLDKKGKPTGKWRPVSLLITDLTSHTIDFTTTTIAAAIAPPVTNTPSQILSGPPSGKTNWRKVLVQNSGAVPSPEVLLLPDSTSIPGSAFFGLDSPFSAGQANRFPYIALDNFGSSIWARVVTVSASTATVTVGAYA